MVRKKTSKASNRGENSFDIRGIMLDPGRVIERKEYYTLLLPWLARWGYNLVHMHLIDDERCALRFPSHPELASPGAFTADEMREFVELAASLGIAVMPEIESLGHAQRIFAQKKFKHLKEPAPKGEARGDFNSLCPAHPETRQLLSELLADVVEIFDYPVIHVGLDEVQLGNCPRCRRKFGAKTPDWKRYAKHAIWVHAEVRRLGRRPAMWADHLVRNFGEGYSSDISKGFKRDVLMFNWDYGPEFKQDQSRKLLASGFEVVACPALIKYGTVMLPFAENISNLRTCASRSQEQKKAGLLGIVTTVWCPWRYLPGAIDLGMAWAGHLCTASSEDPKLAREFAASFYGLSKPAPMAEALLAAYDSGFDMRLVQRLANGKDHLGNTFGPEDVRRCRLIVERLKPAMRVLKAQRKEVSRNRERYQDLLLCLEALTLFAVYGVRGRSKGVPGASRLYQRAEKAWSRDRYQGDRMRFSKKGSRSTQSMLLILKTIS
jgi:Glycosyl hydrolase family 20, catalytic domain